MVIEDDHPRACTRAAPRPLCFGAACLHSPTPAGLCSNPSSSVVWSLTSDAGHAPGRMPDTLHLSPTQNILPFTQRYINKLDVLLSTANHLTHS
jgi:hypothetical protein